MIEDNEFNRAVAGRQLDRLGLELETRERCAPTLTDLFVRIMDGFKFAVRFCERELGKTATSYKRTPAIAVTANVTVDDVSRCKDVGLDDFTPEPVTLKRQRQILIKWLPSPDNVDR